MSTYRKTPEAVARLSPQQYRVTQESGTEAPGSGELLDNHEPGIYVDIVSGITTHYSAAELRELLDAMEFIATDNLRESHALTLLKRKAANRCDAPSR
jgi:SelR domain-containing protein